MQLNEVIIDGIKRGETRTLVFFACTHIGNMGCAKGSIEKAINYVKERKAQWIHLGDVAEFIPRNDKHYDPSIIPKEYLQDFIDGGRDPFKELPQIQIEEAVKIFSPIADLCIGIHGGNHEDKILRYCPGSFDPLSEFITGLRKQTDRQIINLGYGNAWTVLTYKEDNGHSNQIVINTAHGVNKVHNLEKQLKSKECQIIARGHNHEKLESVSVPAIGVRKIRGKLKIVDKTRYALHCGSFLKTYAEGQPGYGEKRDYEPAPIGFMAVHLCFEPYSIKPEVIEYTAELTEAA